MDKVKKIKNNSDPLGKNKKIKSIVIFGAIIVLAICFVSIIGTIEFRKQITGVNSSRMQELSEHDVQLITNSINSRLDLLESIGKDISNRVSKGEGSMPELLHSDYTLVSGVDKLAMLSSDGAMLTNSYLHETRLDITELCAEKGTRFVCRFDNVNDNIPDQRKEYILYSVKTKPIEFDGHIYEYLCCFIKPGELENELKSDSYQGKGFSSVIDYEGNYILNINRSHSFLARDNVFNEIEKVNGFSSVDEFKIKLTTTTTIMNVLATAKINSDVAEEYYIVITPMVV